MSRLWVGSMGLGGPCPVDALAVAAVTSVVTAVSVGRSLCFCRDPGADIRHIILPDYVSLTLHPPSNEAVSKQVVHNLQGDQCNQGVAGGGFVPGAPVIPREERWPHQVEQQYR